MSKNNVKRMERELLKGVKMIAMLAPSFVVEFSYPEIISKLKKIGFDKIVELTFGAKMINREYHKILENSNKLVISSVCPGVVETIKKSFPQYAKNIIKVDSPMIATGKICKKAYPLHKIVFISPCDFKKVEAERSKYVDYIIDYEQLKKIISEKEWVLLGKQKSFDKFYNDYTKIYPLSGALGKTAHLKKILKKNEILIADSIGEVIKFLKKPDKEVKFLDATFCKGGCIGGPHTSKELSLNSKKNKLLKYIRIADKERIPNQRKGVIKKAQGINFRN